jgi:hypothetical protein
MQVTVLDSIFGGARSEYDFHYSGFTRPLLTTLLNRAGFSAVETFESFVDDESGHKISGEPISLNLKAQKQGGAVTYVPEKQASEQGNDLQMYIRAADERLQEILVLKKICDERLAAMGEQHKSIMSLHARNASLQAEVADLQAEITRLSNTIGSRLSRAINKMRG